MIEEVSRKGAREQRGKVFSQLICFAFLRENILKIDEKSAFHQLYNTYV
jgi:hypothetical protein